jgi:hypothetical protein
MSDATAVSDIEREEHDKTFGVKRVTQFEHSGGNLVRKENDPTDGYKITDLDTGYYGYTKADGGWYIMQLTDTAARYVKGDTNYETNWTGRAGLNYGLFFNIF